MSWATRTTVVTLKRGAVLCDRLRGIPDGWVVLLYHRVGRRTTSRVDLPEWLFEEQIARVSALSGVMRLHQALDLSAHRPDIPSLVITFDDGTADFIDYALPVLQRHGVPVTLYVATAFIEEQIQFPQGGRPASWSGLADALTTGLVTIGSHSHRHILFDRVAAGTAAHDLDRSVGLIEDRLGVQVHDFAYPKALPPSASLEAEVRSRFRSAALAGTRPNPYIGLNPYRIARTPIQVEDGLRFFERKIRGGMGMEDDFRNIVNRRRLAKRIT